MLEVLLAKNISFPKGYAGSALCQVTKVRLGKAIGWVRENHKAASIDSFVLGSNARLGHKADGDRIGHEVLELAAPKPVWDLMALYVARLDDLCRPVIKNNLWTIKLAEFYWCKRGS